MAKGKKLELTWIGKENRPRLEPRVLVEEPGRSYHAAHRVSDKDIFDNRLIFGDNLLALKALEQEFAGKVKCIFIDPPYNTGSAFTHYDDGVEHSIWLGLMRDRLELLRRLLSEDGSLWITIDDNECHYLKVLCDEIFGRRNFVANVIWQKKFSPQNDDKGITSSHDHILVYCKNNEKLNINLLPRNKDSDDRYKNPDNDPRGPWSSGDLTSKTKAKGHSYPIKSPLGEVFYPPEGRQWAPAKETFKRWLDENRIWFGTHGKNRPRIKQFLCEVQDGIVPLSIWLRNDAGDNQAAKREVNALRLPGSFDTPKPERLLKRVIDISTIPGDLVLDSFAGSGTTGAVAHKMGRRWIMVELEETCHTHIIPRMKKVIDGEDQGGISRTAKTSAAISLCKDCRDSLCEKCSEKIGENKKGGEQVWFGGGGFRYFRLGPTLIVEDEWGNQVINPEFNPAMLAEAMCKLEGFSFDPNADVYWQQGNSTESDYIYVTTQFMSKEMLTKLSDEVGSSRSLLVCCSAFRCDPHQFDNLTIKKIPKAVLKKCEWGHDDYSLEIENLPDAPPEYLAAQAREEKPARKKPARKFGKGKEAGLPGLFDIAGDAQGGK